MVLDGKIYAIGGVGDGNTKLDTVEVYDRQANSWQRVASMPQVLLGHAAAAMDGKIHVTGARRVQPRELSEFSLRVQSPGRHMDSTCKLKHHSALSRLRSGRWQVLRLR